MQMYLIEESVKDKVKQYLPIFAIRLLCKYRMRKSRHHLSKYSILQQTAQLHS